MTSMQMRNVVCAVGAALVCAAPAAAQQHVPETGGRVYGLVGGTFGEGSFITSGGGGGIRLTSRLGIDVELAHFSGEADRDHGWGPPGWGWGWGWDDTVSVASGGHREDYPPLGADDFPLTFAPDGDRSATTFLTKLTVEFPAAGGRLFPYFTAGGGVGRVTERIGGVFAAPFFGLEQALDLVLPEFPGVPWLDEYAESGPSLVVGGGLDVRLWRGLGVGAEVRWLRVLLSSEDFDAVQVVSRVSYRF